MRKRVSVLFFVVFLALVVQACGASNTPTPAPTSDPMSVPTLLPASEQTLSASDHLDLASQYHDAGDIEKAIAEYQAALEIEPDDAITHLLLGKLYYDQERFDEAAVEYRGVERLSALNPNLMITAPSAGDVYYEQEEYEKAILEYIASLKLNPENIETYMSLASSYYQIEQYENAAQAYEEVLKITPNQPLGNFFLGSVYYYKLGEYEKALPLLEKYLKLEPDTPYKAEVDGIIADISSGNADIFTGESGASTTLKNDTLALVLGILKCESASEVDTKIIYIDQDFSENHVWGKEEWKVTACSETSLYLITFTGDGVGGTYVNAEPLDSPSEVSAELTLTAQDHLNLAAGYLDTGETDKEIAEYLAAIEIEPNNAIAHAYLGVSYYADKAMVEEGIAEMEAAFQLEPDENEVLFFLGLAYYQTEEYEKSISIFERFLELYPNDDYVGDVSEWLADAKDQVE